MDTNTNIYFKELERLKKGGTSFKEALVMATKITPSSKIVTKANITEVKEIQFFALNDYGDPVPISSIESWDHFSSIQHNIASVQVLFSTPK